MPWTAHKSRQRGCWPQPRRDSPCSPSLQNLNAESTEDLSDLCVKVLLTTEDTEALLAREENFVRREEKALQLRTSFARH
jgi:hypothetical protein